VPLANGLLGVFRRFHIWEVDRRAEFSPLKNNDSAGVECPSTCRADIYRLHRQWLIDAGAKLGDEVVECEISPLLSYCGEVRSENEICPFPFGVRLITQPPFIGLC